MNKPRRRAKETDEAYYQRAAKQYFENGYHIDEIAERLNIPIVDVYNTVSNGGKLTTEEERQEMIHLYGNGYSYSAISKIVGRSRSCVRERIDRPCKVPCRTHNPLTDKQIKYIKDGIAAGKYMSTIADELGVKRSVVIDRVKRCGLSSPKKPVTDKEIKRFMRLRKNGRSYEYIAAKCGRSTRTISKYINAELKKNR